VTVQTLAGKERYSTLKSREQICLRSASADADCKVVYEPMAAEPAIKVLFLLKVSISDLNIRKGPGIDYNRVQFIPIGVYTMMEVRSGKGSSAGRYFCSMKKIFFSDSGIASYIIAAAVLAGVMLSSKTHSRVMPSVP